MSFNAGLRSPINVFPHELHKGCQRRVFGQKLVHKTDATALRNLRDRFQQMHSCLFIIHLAQLSHQYDSTDRTVDVSTYGLRLVEPLNRPL
ncbi:unnamed protein product [Protopolystoma xenopodis]|uniref:Uncharacterized protein n=1 Tax=Protopolystoma xenopodis TaxID=117903 RepID=A0A448WV31_9PLAT|nr:unnamed protein product [Protopolystoma xenopodis]